MSVTAMTQNEMVTEVSNIIGRQKSSLSIDDTTTYEARIKQWLYWSHLTMARLYAFSELDQDPIDKVLTTNTYAYTFANIGIDNARLRQVMSVVILDGTDSEKITQKLFRRFESDHPNPAAFDGQQPYFYTLYGRRLELYPKPDSTYTMRIRCNYLPQNFASGTSVSDFLNKDDIIIAGAVTHAYASLQENADAKEWAKVFAARLQNAVGPEMDPADWEPEGRAFDYQSGRPTLTGDFHANPLIYFNP